MTPQTETLLREEPDRLVAVFRRMSGQELAVVLADDGDQGRVLELRLGSITGRMSQTIPLQVHRLPELIEALTRARAQADRLGWIEPAPPPRRLQLKERPAAPKKDVVGRPRWTSDDEF